MLYINLYKNKNQNSQQFGRVYGRVKNADPIGVAELAKHRTDHNSPYSQGVIKGILTDMVACIKELILLGQPVKLGDLGIFSAQVTSGSSADAAHFEIGKHIKNVRLLCKATGEIRQAKLTAEGILGFTDLAQKIISGEAVLSNEKGKYLAGGE